MNALVALVVFANGLEIQLQTPPANLGQYGDIICNYRIAKNEKLEAIALYKTAKTDVANHLVFQKAENTAWAPNPRIIYELKTEVDGFDVSKATISDIELSDKGTYFCEIIYTKGESPVVLSDRQSSDLDVYFPPASLTITNEIYENNIIEITCQSDSSYPDATYSINLDNIITEKDISNGKVYTYALSPLDKNKIFICTASHAALDSDLTDSFNLTPINFPSAGDMVENVTLGDLTTNVKLVSEFPMTPDNSSLIISSLNVEAVNETCTVSISADACCPYPPVKNTWFNGDVFIGEGDQISFVTNTNGSESNVTVVAISSISRAAVMAEYRSLCFPPIPPTVSSNLADQTASPLGPRGVDNGAQDPARVASQDESEAGNQTDPIFENPTDDNVDEGGLMNGAIIAAITGGTFVGIVLIGVALYFLCFKKNEKAVYKPNDKGPVEEEVHSDYEVTASVDLNDVVQASNPDPVKRSLSGTWNKPSSTAETEHLLEGARRSISTQTLERKSESIVYGSTTSVHV